jgi:hypothetical protein
MNWKGYGRKQLWSNLRSCSGICLEGLRKTTEALGQDSQSPGWDLNPGPPKYEVGVLTSWLWYLVLTYEVRLFNNETFFLKNIVLKFMYIASYLLQKSSLGLVYSVACVSFMRGNISGNHFVWTLLVSPLFFSGCLQWIENVFPSANVLT